mmetsp:Transcript_8729/g.19375  ORF Transcript_8729/g.19375 Transcript_8729/m.19375 type:complete len:220 (+) Transcript_8729:172-831(+)
MGTPRRRGACLRGARGPIGRLEATFGGGAVVVAAAELLALLALLLAAAAVGVPGSQHQRPQAWRPGTQGRPGLQAAVVLGFGHFGSRRGCQHRGPLQPAREPGPAGRALFFFGATGRGAQPAALDFGVRATPRSLGPGKFQDCSARVFVPEWQSPSRCLGPGPRRARACSRSPLPRWPPGPGKPEKMRLTPLWPSRRWPSQQDVPVCCSVALKMRRPGD